MSDFLQFVDRIPTLPNRKKLTFDDLSVKYAKVEYADEPIEEGTFLNKANFNKLNNVLGYNECSVTQSEGIEEKIFSNNDIVWKNLSGSTPFAITSTIETDIGDIYFLKYLGTKVTGYVNNSNCPLYITSDSTYNLELFKSMEINNSMTGNSSYAGITTTSARTGTGTLLFETPINIKTFSIGGNTLRGGQNYFSNGTIKLYYQNSLIKTETIYQQQVKYTYSFDDYTLIDKVELSVNGTNSSYRCVLQFTIDDFKKEVLSKYNNYSIPLNNLINNQRFLIETPSNVEIQDVINNTINNIICDKILGASTKYEIIYDEINNMFKVNNHTIFDITINETVDEIETNLKVKDFIVGRVYIAFIFGMENNATATVGLIGINENTGILIGSINSVFSPSIAFIYNNGEGLSSLYKSNSSGFGSSSHEMEQNQFVKIKPNNYPLLNGTRIVIQEVL